MKSKSYYILISGYVVTFLWACGDVTFSVFFHIHVAFPRESYDDN